MSTPDVSIAATTVNDTTVDTTDTTTDTTTTDTTVDITDTYTSPWTSLCVVTISLYPRVEFVYGYHDGHLDVACAQPHHYHTLLTFQQELLRNYTHPVDKCLYWSFYNILVCLQDRPGLKQIVLLDLSTVHSMAVYTCVDRSVNIDMSVLKDRLYVLLSPPLTSPPTTARTSSTTHTDEVSMYPSPWRVIRLALTRDPRGYDYDYSELVRDDNYIGVQPRHILTLAYSGDVYLTDSSGGYVWQYDTITARIRLLRASVRTDTVVGVGKKGWLVQSHDGHLWYLQPKELLSSSAVVNTCVWPYVAVQSQIHSISQGHFGNVVYSLCDDVTVNYHHRTLEVPSLLWWCLRYVRHNVSKLEPSSWRSRLPFDVLDRLSKNDSSWQH